MAGDRNGSSRREGAQGAAGGALALAADAVRPVRARTASPHKVMIIRHAEKPTDAAEPGIGAGGRHSADGLVVCGWQRAGALARFFAPRDGRFADPALARPAAIIAAAPTASHPSERSVLTVGPLAALLDIVVETRFGPHQTTEAAAAALRQDGPVLFAWEHKRIADLVLAVTDREIEVPPWPRERYDVVLVLDREPAGWLLTEVPQRLLAGDSAERIVPLPAGAGPG